MKEAFKELEVEVVPYKAKNPYAFLEPNPEPWGGEEQIIEAANAQASTGMVIDELKNHELD